MALGPYVNNKISEARLDGVPSGLLEQYNSVVGSTTGPAGNWGFAARTIIHNTLFTQSSKALYQNDASTGGSVSLTSGTSLLFESGNTGSSTIDFTTAGQSAVIVLQASAEMNFVDKGSAGDAGDIIIGSNAAQYIAIDASNLGSNTIIGGSGKDTLVGGSHADTLVSGGSSSLVAGSGSERLVGGFFATSHDTLVGGSGADLLKTKFGTNSIIAGTSTETTIRSGYNGSASDQVTLAAAGGAAFVSIGSGSTDTVTYGSVAGADRHDTISNSGHVDINIASGEHFSGISAAGGVTTISFSDGGSLSISGTGTTTIHFPV